MSASSTGRLHAWRVRWFGEPDHVADQLRDIARQGSGMARMAHACAFLLIVLFSAGSLVALGADALAAIQAQWERDGGLNIPAAIALGVSTLLVLCMDVAMVYAASMLRLLASRQAEEREKRVHQAVIAVVAALEAGTYAYMSWRFESPADAIAWALILSRALAAPLLSVYLSMARPLPVTSRDILYQAELAAGQGVIRDVVEVASDQGAPLAEKMALYGAAATMTPQDRSRLDSMISAVEKRTERRMRTPETETPRHPPTGPGSPLQAPETGADGATDTPAPRRLRAVSQPRQAAASGRGTNPRSRRGVRTRQSPDEAERRARKAWVPGMSVSELQKAAGISRTAASKHRRILLAEEATQEGQGVAQ
jgi:methionine-rich copper-binding protein CopC